MIPAKDTLVPMLLSSIRMLKERLDSLDETVSYYSKRASQSKKEFLKENKEKRKLYYTVEDALLYAESVVSILDRDDFDKYELSESSYWWGYYNGMLWMTAGHDSLCKFAFSVTSSKNITNSRWKKRDEEIRPVLDEMLSEAEKIWGSGDNAWHNEMATYLLGLDKFSGAKSYISERMLRNALRPVAMKYGRVRGLAKAKQKNLPPS